MHLETTSKVVVSGGGISSPWIIYEVCFIPPCAKGPVTENSKALSHKWQMCDGGSVILQIQNIKHVGYFTTKHFSVKLLAVVSTSTTNDQSLHTYMSVSAIFYKNAPSHIAIPDRYWQHSKSSNEHCTLYDKEYTVPQKTESRATWA